MPALRPRTLFAASFVMTVAACSKKDSGGGPSEPPPTTTKYGFTSTWSVSKLDPPSASPNDPPGACRALIQVHCGPRTDTGSGVATCNPPSPELIPCPPGAERGVKVAKKVYTDPDCWLRPDGCDDTSCVTQKVRCPWTQRELSQLVRGGSKGADGRCIATWQPPVYSKPQFVVPCPAEGITQFQITRPDLDKPCVLAAAGIEAKEIPCPVEPPQFATAGDYDKQKGRLAGTRVQVQATKGTVAALGCGPDTPDDQTRVVVDGRVTASGVLEDCAIWQY